MGVATGISMLKFINYGIFGLIIVGILAGVINGFINYRETGDKKMLVENTLGEIVTWDSKIHISMSQLLNKEFLETVPEEVRGDYVSGLAKNVIIHIFLFAVLLYLLFRLGSWCVGISQFSPLTDCVIILLSLLVVFILAPLLYGYLMDVEVTLFRGIYLWFTNFAVWWNALGGTTIAQGVTTPIAETVVDNATEVINLG